MPQFPQLSGAVQESSGKSRKAELDSMMSEIKNKKTNLDSVQAAGAINDEELRRKLLGSLFEVLQASGVDPNDLESISRFLQELEAQSPDLYRLFQEAFDILAGNEVRPVEDQGLMRRFGNLAQGTMMPGQETGAPPSVSGMVPGAMPPGPMVPQQ